MRTRKLGRTGLMVTELGIGAGPIRHATPEYGARLVRRALDLGINYFDTASAYGDSEDKLGTALGVARKEIFVATKLDAVTSEEGDRELASSLRKLRTDYVDVLQLHGVSDFDDLDRRTGPGGVWETLLRAKREGAARFIGITAHRHDVLVEAIRRCDPDMVLTIMNVVERDATKELIPLALQKDVGLVVMKPLAMGLLPARLAIRFLLNQPISCAIPGPTRIEWLEENVAIAEDTRPLDVDELAEIERLRQLYHGTRCRLCNICEPCPRGVPMAYPLGTYRFLNDLRNMGKDVMKSFPYGGWAHENLPRELACITDGIDLCDDCGLCEQRCPHGLRIPALLRAMRPALADLKEVVSSW